MCDTAESENLGKEHCAVGAFDKSQFCPLFSRYHTTDLAKTISEINRVKLNKKYREAIRYAPSRSSRKKPYFGSHTGDLLGDGPSNRFEEHLAIALWSLRGDWPRSGGGRTRLLDYQVPLYSCNRDQIGAIDLVGVTEAGGLVVIELKVKPRTGRSVTPVEALMQGLGYAAVAHANRSTIADETKECFGVPISDDPPIVQLLAPKAWWRGWTDMKKSTRNAAGDWEPAFADLIQDIDQQLDVSVECLALTDVGPADIDYGSNGKRPRLLWTPELHPVTGRTLHIDEALPPHRIGED